MKFFLLAAFLTVAAAVPMHRDGLVTPAAAGPAPVILPQPIAVGPAIIDSFEPEIIASPAVVSPFPISVGPALVEEPVYEPISVGPAVVDFPVTDGGAVSAPVVPSPVVIGPIAPGAPIPLVQIILNIKNADSTTSPVSIIAPQPEIQPTPVTVVDSAPIAVEPVQVVDIAPVPAEPVQVIEAAPVPVEPVIIGTPIIPSPAVVLPETLN